LFDLKYIFFLLLITELSLMDGIHTCTGLAATNKPATPPPTTRPSGLAKETLMPPDLLRVPPLSFGVKEPDKDRISNNPCRNSSKEDGISSHDG
jgi:hypothetical protein